MNQSTITIDVVLDKDKVPEQINWRASDSTADTSQKSRAMMLSFWDGADKTAMRIDLWTKDMPVEEMKRFYIDTIGAMAESLKTATNDDVMVQKMRTLCEEMVNHINQQEAQ